MPLLCIRVSTQGQSFTHCGRLCTTTKRLLVHRDRRNIDYMLSSTLAVAGNTSVLGNVAPSGGEHVETMRLRLMYLGIVLI